MWETTINGILVKDTYENLILLTGNKPGYVFKKV